VAASPPPEPRCEALRPPPPRGLGSGISFDGVVSVRSGERGQAAPFLFVNEAARVD
jgi:hypothetical protein